MLLFSLPTRWPLIHCKSRMIYSKLHVYLSLRISCNLKMGSGASTTVKAIDIDSKEIKGKDEKTTDESKQPDQCLVEEVIAASFEEDSGIIKTDERVKELERKLAESESENLDLQDRIQSLEERLQEHLRVQLAAIPEEGEEPCTETVQAKDQFINKQEAELQTLQQENSKMKVRYKKKVKSLSSQLSEAKQESSIQLFELNDEISRLKEENQQLKNQLKGDDNPDTAGTGLTAGVSGHMSLILDLSQQVSEQEQKIKRLEENLAEKTRIIKKYRSDGSGSAGLELKEEVLVSASWNEDMDTNKDSEFMSRGWLNSQSRELAPVETNKLEEGRQLCSSRDSGFGSAGKTKTNSLGVYNASRRITSASSHLSGLHEDSDSDWGSESSPSSHFKAQSAPPGSRSPHLLTREDSGGDNWSISSKSSTKSKKKKSLLKSRVDSGSDCRPKGSDSKKSDLLGPTLAFVETS